MKLVKAFYIYSVMYFIFTGSVHAGSIYKWTDDDGNVHYGERPPAKGATEVRIRNRGGVEKMDAPANPATQPDPKAQRDKMIQALEGDRLARQEKKQKQAKKVKKHKMQCARAKDKLRRYQRASSLYKLDTDGNRVTLPQSVKQQATERLQDEIKKWCK